MTDNLKCEGGQEAHDAHMLINDECPWCGAGVPPRVAETTARNIRPGDSILIDPLDPRSVADVADVETSQHHTTITLTAVYRGDIITAALSADHPVRRVS